MLFKMRMNGVLPIIPRVNELPIFRAVLLYGEAQFVAVRKPIVDCPLSVVAIKLEVARDSRRDDARKLIELRVSRRINAGIRHRGADLELYTGSTLASREDVAAWPLAIVLLQTVLQTDLGVTPD